MQKNSVEEKDTGNQQNLSTRDAIMYRNHLKTVLKYQYITIVIYRFIAVYFNDLQSNNWTCG